jgi:hypothetical protein
MPAPAAPAAARGQRARPTEPPLEPPAERARSLVLTGISSALGAALLGLVTIELVVVVLWGTDVHSTASSESVLRFGAALWLLAHHVPLAVQTPVPSDPAGTVGLVPLGLTVLPALLVARAGTAVARLRTGRWEGDQPVGGYLGELGAVTAAVALPYALLTGLVSGPAAVPSLRPAPAAAVLGGLVLAAVAAGAGALRVTGVAPLTTALPQRVRAVLAAGLAGAATLLGVGAVVAAVSLAVHYRTAVELTHAVRPGIVGGAGLLLLGVVLVPNAAVWAAAYCLGPGFALGVDSAVGPLVTDLGPVPALPLLAALPAGPTPPPAVAALAVLPLAAGVAAGRVLIRRCPGRGPGRLAALGIGLAAGPVAGVVAGLAALLSGGPAGPGRLATIGPSGWQVALAATAAVGVPAALTAGGTSWWRRRRTAVDPAPDD